MTAPMCAAPFDAGRSTLFCERDYGHAGKHKHAGVFWEVCESCLRRPAQVIESFGEETFAVCATCANGGRVEPMASLEDATDEAVAAFYDTAALEALIEEAPVRFR